MKFQIKNIKYSASLSEETNAFTCSVWVDGRKAGFAKNGGFGGCTDVRIDTPALRKVALNNARSWLDIVEPFPVDFSVAPTRCKKTGRDVFARTTADQRSESTPEGQLVDLVDHLLRNHLVLKYINKVQSAVTWRTKECGAGEYVRIAVKPAVLTTEQRNKIENKPDFIEWLYDRSIDEIATILEFTEHRSGPITVSVSLTS